MKTYLIFDTETTGFPNSLPAKDPNQGRVCQLAMLLCDEEGNHLSEMSFYIIPDGWKIQEGAKNVHGITEEICEKHGIKSSVAYSLFNHFVKIADCIVAHNIEFDLKMMKIEAEAHNYPMPELKDFFCTMKKTINICKLAGNYGSYKYPKLSEALLKVCGREIGNSAHDALVDAKACKEIFFKLLNEKMAA